MLRDRDVIDLGYASPAFTWSSNAMQTQSIFERLDRDLCITDWRLLFTDAAVLHLPSIDIDHSPILLNTMRRPPKRKRTRSSNTTGLITFSLMKSFSPNGKIRRVTR